MEHRFKITSFSRRFCTIFGAFFIDLFRCVSSNDPNYIYPDDIIKDNDWHDDTCRPFSKKRGKIHDFHFISCYKIFNICICNCLFFSEIPWGLHPCYQLTSISVCEVKLYIFGTILDLNSGLNTGLLLKTMVTKDLVKNPFF